MKQIVCLSNEAWSHSPGRTQQLITRLKHTQVLFFSPSSSWREIRFRAKGRAVKPNITVYPLPPLLLPADERYGPLFRLEQLRLAASSPGRMEEHPLPLPPALVRLPGAGPPAGPSGLRRSDLRLRPGVGRPAPGLGRLPGLCR